MLQYLEQHYLSGKRLVGSKTLTALTLMLVAVNLFAPMVGLNIVAAQVSSQSLLELHNVERLNAGLKPLKLNSTLSSSAAQKAAAMLASDCWSHYCPNGKSPWDFFNSVGYDYLYAGENLAEGFYSNEDVMRAWMNSPTHRANVLNSHFDEIGFGFVRGKFQNNSDNIIVVVHFGTLKTNANVDNENNPQLATPEILSPTNNSYFSSKEIEVFGKAPAGSQVKLFLNGDRNYFANADKGLFTHKLKDLGDGRYTLTAQAFNKNSDSDYAEPIVFTIDTVADKINEGNFTIWQNQLGQKNLLLNKTQIKSATLTYQNETVEMTENKDGVWSVPLSAIQSKQVNIKFVDLAGNVTNSSINIDLVNTIVESNGGLLGISGANLINILTIGFILFMLGTDLFFLNRFKQQHDGHNHGYFHIGVLAAVVVAIIMNSLAGHILTGISS